MKPAQLYFILPILLALTGYAQPSPAPATAGQMIASYGSHPAAGGILTIKVLPADGKLTVTRGEYFDKLICTNAGTGQTTTSYNAHMTNSVTLGGWKATNGWFVFVEDQSRVWAYDGNHDLMLVTTHTCDGFAIRGCENFPCPVPTQVFDRLPDAEQKKLKKGQH